MMGEDIADQDFLDLVEIKAIKDLKGVAGQSAFGCCPHIYEIRSYRADVVFKKDAAAARDKDQCAVHVKNGDKDMETWVG